MVAINSISYRVKIIVMKTKRAVEHAMPKKVFVQNGLQSLLYGNYYSNRKVSIYSFNCSYMFVVID